VNNSESTVKSSPFSPESSGTSARTSSTLPDCGIVTNSSYAALASERRTTTRARESCSARAAALPGSDSRTVNTAVAGSLLSSLGAVESEQACTAKLAISARPIANNRELPERSVIDRSSEHEIQRTRMSHEIPSGPERTTACGVLNHGMPRHRCFKNDAKHHHPHASRVRSGKSEPLQVTIHTTFPLLWRGSYFGGWRPTCPHLRGMATV
jgi:hypothetical protein